MDKLREAPWNANVMDRRTSDRLRESVSRYGLLQPLVIRPVAESAYETLSGNQRLRIMREMGFESAPCVIVNLGDSEAMLLAQALNAIRGEDDLAIKGSLLKKILSAIPEDKVLSLLPETTESLKALSSIGQEDLAQHLKAWEQAQTARLKHMQLQFSGEQLETVEKALDLIMAKARDSVEGNPNVRGTAIYLLARFYLQRNGK
jgi:ParB family chromosome partitioning protein